LGDRLVFSNGIILLVMLFLAINRQYKYVAKRLSLENFAPRSSLSKPKTDIINQPALVVVGQLNQVTVFALDYVRSITELVIGHLWYDCPILNFQSIP
jgi:hypothetical protein